MNRIRISISWIRTITNIGILILCCAFNINVHSFFPNNAPLSEADKRAMEEFQRYMETLPEDEQRKIFEEVNQFAAQYEQELASMSPAERAQFEQTLENEFKAMAGTPNNATPPIPSPVTPEPKAQPTKDKDKDKENKQAQPPIAPLAEQQKLKGILHTILEHIDSILLKSASLPTVSTNKRMVTTWNDLKNDLGSIHAYVSIIASRDRLINFILTPEFTPLYTALQKISKTLTTHDEAINVPDTMGLKSAKHTTHETGAESRVIQRAQKSFESAINALNNLTMPIIKNGKNLFSKYAPEEIKVVEAAKKVTPTQPSGGYKPGKPSRPNAQPRPNPYGGGYPGQFGGQPHGGGQSGQKGAATPSKDKDKDKDKPSDKGKGDKKDDNGKKKEEAPKKAGEHAKPGEKAHEQKAEKVPNAGGQKPGEEEAKKRGYPTDPEKALKNLRETIERLRIPETIDAYTQALNTYAQSIAQAAQAQEAQPIRGQEAQGQEAQAQPTPKDQLFERIHELKALLQQAELEEQIQNIATITEKLSPTPKREFINNFKETLATTYNALKNATNNAQRSLQVSGALSDVQQAEFNAFDEHLDDLKKIFPHKEAVAKKRTYAANPERAIRDLSDMIQNLEIRATIQRYTQALAAYVQAIPNPATPAHVEEQELAERNLFEIIQNVTHVLDQAEIREQVANIVTNIQNLPAYEQVDLVTDLNNTLTPLHNDIRAATELSRLQGNRIPEARRREFSVFTRKLTRLEGLYQEINQHAVGQQGQRQQTWWQWLQGLPGAAQRAILNIVEQYLPGQAEAAGETQEQARERAHMLGDNVQEGLRRVQDQAVNSRQQ